MEPVNKTPVRQWCDSFPSRTSIDELLRLCVKHNLSDETGALFLKLARQPADLRLATNLRTFLGLAVYQEVSNILCEGLTTDERKALIELDSSNVPATARETAHGLLNVRERWLALKSLSRSFREAKRARSHCLDSQLLKEISGGSK